MTVILREPYRPDGRGFLRLTVRKQYEVLGIEGDWFRILDETGEPVLFDPQCFEVTDPAEPDFWLSFVGDEGERYAYPPEWNVPGFFEKWHDGNVVVREAFAAQLAARYPPRAGLVGEAGPEVS